MARRNRAPASREADPKPLSEALRGLSGKPGWDAALALGKLRAKWTSVVGDHIATRSEPIKLENGRLTVRVEGGAWSAELALMGQELATNVARFLGQDLVREVAIVTGSPRRERGSSIGPI